MIARVTAVLLLLSVVASSSRADDDPEPPPRLAGEVVKVEVTCYTGRDGSKSRSHEAKVKEIVGNLLAHFPEVATGRKPDAGAPAPSGLSYCVVLRRAKGRPVHVFIRGDGRRWFCYNGTAEAKGDWALKKPKETARFLDGLLDP